MIKLKLLDLAKKSKINRWYDFFLATLQWERRQLEEYQNARLRKLLQYAYDNIEFYRMGMQERNVLPSQVNSFRDLERLPMIHRDDIRANGNKLTPVAIELSKCHKGTSSGTTGVPITYYHDVTGESAGMAAGYVLWSMSGWRFGKRNVHIWGNATSIQRWATWSSRAKNVLIRQLNIPSIWLDDPEGIEDVSRKIMKFDPISIEGYPGAIYTLAQHCQKKGYSLPSLKQVLTTAENLESYQRSLIEKVFAPTGDLYGSGEVLGIATRPIADDKYYVFDPHVIVEAVDSWIPGTKDVVVTDLDNYAMPLIRYRIGDMIDDLHLPEKGSQYPFSYFNRIIGRNSDIVDLPNGKRFHPINIFGGTLFRKYPEIVRHKVIWNGKLLKILFETVKPVNAKGIETDIKELLSVYEVPFMIKYVDQILPATNGKYKYFEKVVSAD